jgi:hypothetical protein
VDGTPVTEDDIIKALKDFRPDEEHIYVDVYSLSKCARGLPLRREFNSDQKPPSGAAAIDLNPTKTPSRRLISKIMDKSKILARAEVETPATRFGTSSRKLITTPTMERPCAVHQGPRELEVLKDGRYSDLVDFYCSFIDEWATTTRPGSPEHADARWDLRHRSFALSNIIIHPMFRLAFELWRHYDENQG